AAGTFLTPMMFMITVGSTVCGQLVSRFGRYQWAGIIGPILNALGLFLMSQVRPSTPHMVAICYMVLMGFGLGLLMPLYTLVSQNAVNQRLLGVVTSLGQFFRSIGGTLGAAIFQTILLSQYDAYFKSHLPGNVSSDAARLFQNPLKLKGLSEL